MEHDFSSYMNNTKIDTTFHFVPIDEEQTLTIIGQLKAKKSMGYDNISQILLQKSAKPLTCIINQSLKTGVFPNNLKIAKIIPIFKTNDKYDFNNYRPISLLPSISKIFEKVVYI